MGIFVGGTGSANQIDDYEEGTFSPAWFDDGGVFVSSYGRKYGQYTKIGNICHFVFGLGAYVKNKLMPNDPIYNRIGLRYLFRNRIQAHFVLKAHYARADYFELGIGYVFNGKKR